MAKKVFVTILLGFLCTFSMVDAALCEDLPDSGLPRSALRVGVAVPLSGSLAFAGQDIQRGMELAVEESKPDDLRIELLFEDSQQNPRQTLTVAKMLLEQRKVDVIVSLWDMAEIVAPLAERKGVPHLSIRWNPHVAEKYTYTFTMESTYHSYVREQLRLLQSLGIKRIAILSEESEGWNLALEAEQAEAPKYGIEIITVVQFLPGTTDYGVFVTKALAKKPEYLLLNTFTPTTVPLFRRILEQAPSQKIIGYFEGDPDKALFEGRPYVGQFKAASWFEEKFSARFKEPYQIRAPQAYDIIKTLQFIFRGRDKTLPFSEFEKGFRGLTNFPGAAGTLDAHGGKTLENILVWRVVRNGVAVDWKP